MIGALPFVGQNVYNHYFSISILFIQIDPTMMLSNCLIFRCQSRIRNRRGIRWVQYTSFTSSALVETTNSELLLRVEIMSRASSVDFIPMISATRFSRFVIWVQRVNASIERTSRRSVDDSINSRVAEYCRERIRVLKVDIGSQTRPPFSILFIK